MDLHRSCVCARPIHDLDLHRSCICARPIHDLDLHRSCVCARPIHDLDLLLICRVFFCVQWVQLRWEVIVRFVDVGGIGDHKIIV
jgi:hypothetical protein